MYVLLIQELNKPSGTYYGPYADLEVARNDALEYVESQGWIHEQYYATQPDNGVAWDTPSRNSAINIYKIQTGP